MVELNIIQIIAKLEMLNTLVQLLKKSYVRSYTALDDCCETAGRTSLYLNSYSVACFASVYRPP